MIQLLLSLALLTPPAFSRNQTFRYVCYPAKGVPLYQMEINPSQLQFRAADEHGSRLFLNQGERGGGGKYRDWLRYQYALGAEGPDEPSRVREYLAEPRLLTGGTNMHNGSTGGFIAYLAPDLTVHHLACERR